VPLERAVITAVCAEHAARISALVPGAQVELSGSALVPALRADDVDLVLLSDDVLATADVLVAAYSPLYPENWSDDWAALRIPGPPQVDVVVTRAGSWGDKLHRGTWVLICERVDLQDEYRAIKEEPAAYAERKGAFFERVLALLDD